MLQIRPAQMLAFEHDLLVRRVARYLNLSYPQASFPPVESARISLIENALRRARARGYSSTDSLLKFAHVTFLLGEDFESRSGFEWTRQILDDTEYIPSERLIMLEEEAIARMTVPPPTLHEPAEDRLAG
jgi:hypothetical protein